MGVAEDRTRRRAGRRGTPPIASGVQLGDDLRRQMRERDRRARRGAASPARTVDDRTGAMKTHGNERIRAYAI